MGAVAVVVGGVVVVVDEVRALEHLAGEVGVVGVHAGVDHGDFDARAGGGGPGLGGLHVGDAPRVGELGIVRAEQGGGVEVVGLDVDDVLGVFPGLDGLHGVGLLGDRVDVGVGQIQRTLEGGAGDGAGLAVEAHDDLIRDDGLAVGFLGQHHLGGVGPHRHARALGGRGGGLGHADGGQAGATAAARQQEGGQGGDEGGAGETAHETSSVVETLSGRQAGGLPLARQ
ncbi:hypothetical protein D3C72_1490630 [compost metagenome]